MSQVLIAYWSGTGNTEKMAELVKKGLEESGKTVDLESMSSVNTQNISNYEAIVLGSPSMGCEELEETEVVPFIEDIEGKISGKKIALFGSYGWGNGEWMESWQERMDNSGANMLFDKGLICNETPDGDSAEECVEYGKQIAANI